MGYVRSKQDRIELKQLRKACMVGGKFDYRKFNLAWAELHGTVEDPSKSIVKRQKASRDKHRTRTGQAVRD